MQIVVLDAHTLNPGDLSWAPLEALGTCTVYPRTAPADVMARARGAEVVLTNKTRLRAEHFAALPGLRYVGVLATGHDVVDAKAAAARGIVVSNVPAYGTASVAQMTFALLLELCNHVGLHAEAARAGRWSASGEFSYRERPSVELAGLCLGVVGLGRIGRAVATIGRAFGMRAVAASASARQAGDPEAAGAGDAAVQRVSFDELLAGADVVSLHCPLTPETAQLINAERLGRMQAHALLINTARGALIDEQALYEALVHERLGGAGLDVLATEPPPPDHPLLHAPRCLVTPHMAWATRASRQRLLSAAIDNVAAFLRGAPRNLVV